MARTIKQNMQAEESNSDDGPGSAAPVEGSSGVSDGGCGSPVVLTVEEAARICRVNPKTYYTAVKAGKAPGKRIGRRLVVSREALLNWLRSSGSVLPSRRGETG